MGRAGLLLVAGTKFGPYEIAGPLGAGGMGEVYCARDARLRRDVAVKVLPASYSRDPDRLRRFEQEARAAGALNHPNILAIYDVGTQDGTPFLVTELLEGETLEKRLRGGPLPVRKAVEIAIQAANGTAAAHEKHIVHRDLKPANIFLTRDGRVKILDFGLAKLTEHEASGIVDSQSPTVTAHPLRTEPGAVFGTVGYMSPEQVRGKPADPRSDIFSFGAVLYEMLTGKRAFHGNSSIETMSAILNEEPEEISSAQRNVSPGLERLVNHCLRKEPEARFQSARDLAFALEALSGDSGTSSAERARAPNMAAARRKRRIIFAAAGTLALVAAGAGAYFLGRGAAAPASLAYQRLTFRNGIVESARFGPDGQTILYTAAWGDDAMDVFSTRPDSSESRSLGLPPSSEIIAVSPSGEIALLLGAHIVLPDVFQMRGTLAEMPLAGGAPREVLKDVSAADWPPDGKQLAVVRQVRPGKETLEYPIGKVLYATQGWIGSPRFSPDGKHIAFVDHPSAFDDGGTVAVIDLSGKKTTLTRSWPSIRGVAWSPSGGAIWFTASPTGASRRLYSVTLSGHRHLIAQVPGDLTLFDVAKDGRALVIEENEREELAALSAQAPGERNLSWLDWSTLLDLSADGKTVLFSESGEGGGPNYSVYLRNLDGSPAVRLGDGGGTGALSPNGQWAVVQHPHAAGPAQLFLLPTGAGEPRQLTSGNSGHVNSSWMPDGKAILFTRRAAGHRPQVYEQPLDSGPAHAITPEGFSIELPHAVSPDGKSFLAKRSSDGKWVLFPIGGGDAQPIPGVMAGDIPIQWTADGHSLYVYRMGTRASPAKIYRIGLANGKRTLVKEWMPADRTGLQSFGLAEITPDGKTIVYSYMRMIANLYLAQGGR